MTRIRTGRSISIDIDIVRTLGANAAVVHQQVLWTIDTDEARGITQSHAPGWYTGTSEQLSAITGLTVKQVRVAMAKLIEAGLIERRKWRSNRGDQTLSFRPIDDVEVDPTGGDDDDEASAPEGTCSSASEGGSTSVSEGKSKPPLPPQGGDHPELGLEQPPETQAERRRRKDQTDANDLVGGWVKAMFGAWPGSSSQRGKPEAARRALTNALAEGWTQSEIRERMEGWQRARLAYHDLTGHDAPIMHVSRFINELRKDREGTPAGEPELWTLDEYDLEWIRGRWPAPRGRDWDSIARRRSVDDDGSGRRRRRSLEDALAEEAATKGANHG